MQPNCAVLPPSIVNNDFSAQKVLTVGDGKITICEPSVYDDKPLSMMIMTMSPQWLWQRLHWRRPRWRLWRRWWQCWQDTVCIPHQPTGCKRRSVKSRQTRFVEIQSELRDNGTSLTPGDVLGIIVNRDNNENICEKENENLRICQNKLAESLQRKTWKRKFWVKLTNSQSLDDAYKPDLYTLQKYT